MHRIAARSHFLERAQMLFAPPARIIDFQVRVVANIGKELNVEKRSVVGKLRRLIAVAKTVRFVSHGEGERHDVAGSERLLESIDRVQIAGLAADQVKRPIEMDLRDRIMLVGQMYL